ncbi:MAG: BatA domain-containing protein [Chthoniobacterales bacterium]|nr:BatA domain-containing protein [Chthoniobacterales bacterium]
MTFLAPTLLVGLDVIAAPIAIHLLNRRKVTVVRWGATRFLRESLNKNQRRLRVEDLILLLLRCLLIALLALAFARPVLNPGGAASTGAYGPAIQVLLLDQSASMEQSNGLQTRFEQAKAAAGKELERLAQGSQAALFLVSNRVNQIIARPTPQLTLVRHALDLAEPTGRTADLPSAIKTALETLRTSVGAKKEVVVFTDNQLNAWSGLEDVRTALLAAPDIQLRVVSAVEHGEDNVAITSLKPASSMIAAGQPVGCVVEVSNFGTTLVAATRVTLTADDGPPIDAAVIDQIEAGKSRAVQLNARFDKPGYYTLTAAIGSDRFPADNKRSLAIRVIDHLFTTIVDGDADAAPQDRAGFFLANALIPISPSRRESYYLKTETITPAALAAADLSRKNIIFLCDVARLDPAAAQNVQRYVREGGALVTFPGPQVKAATYNNDVILSEMLPARLGDLRDPGAEGKFASWQPNEYKSPVTAIWNENKNGNLGSVRATKFFPLTLTPSKNENESAHAIVNYADGSPAIAEKSYGKGRVVLFSSTANTKWSNLPIHPDFVPLLQRLVAFVAPDEQPGQINLQPGAALQVKVAADLVGREINVLVPGGKGKPRPTGKVELINQEAVVRYRDTDEPGAYRFFAAGSDRAIAACAVQIDPAESDLRTIPPEQLAGLTSKGVADAHVSHSETATGVRRELWGLLILLAALVALVEMVLAHKFSFAK